VAELDRAALDALAAERARIRDAYLQSDRPASSGRGMHHTTLLCADLEQTVAFYRNVLEFPLTEMVANGEQEGSTRFYFDIGNGNLLGFFDLPGVDLSDYAEVVGGMHHIAISAEPARWSQLKANLDVAGVPYEITSGTSVYFRDPNGARLELTADPLGDIRGEKML